MYFLIARPSSQSADFIILLPIAALKNHAQVRSTNSRRLKKWWQSSLSSRHVRLLTWGVTYSYLTKNISPMYNIGGWGWSAVVTHPLQSKIKWKTAKTRFVKNENMKTTSRRVKKYGLESLTSSDLSIRNYCNHSPFNMGTSSVRNIFYVRTSGFPENQQELVRWRNYKKTILLYPRHFGVKTN
jgi:hypothetical protein